MLKPNWFEPAVSVVSPIRGAPSANLISKPESCQSATTAEIAIDLAVKKFPDRQLAYLLSPEPMEDRHYFEINLAKAGDWNARDGDTTLYIDPVCARIAGVVDGAMLSAAEAVQRAKVPSHNGLLFGITGQILVFLAGLTLPILYVTGMVVWWRRRKNRRTR